jgi:hypothetical protein
VENGLPRIGWNNGFLDKALMGAPCSGGAVMEDTMDFNCVKWCGLKKSERGKKRR